MNWIEQAEITIYADPGEETVILYSPLARKSAAVARERYSKICTMREAPDDLRFLTDYISYDERPSVKQPQDYTLLTVLPNNRCNFACTYCYSAGCRDDRELNIETLDRCIDYFIESKINRPDKRKLTVSYMGGGEPLLSWEVVEKSILHALGKARDTDLELNFRIITNGSLLTDEQLAFLLEHRIAVSVSFEVLEEIQNLQRRHFERVDANLRRLLAVGVDTQLNVTITPANVGRMAETYRVMRQRYPSITNAMFEPVTAEELFETPLCMRTFYDEYIDGFLTIYEEGRAEGVDITSFPYLRTVYPVKRACPGEFCITADGKITGCYCVSTDNHPLFNRTCYGDFLDGCFEFDADTFHRLLACNKDSKPECRDCSARWNCGGGCFHLFNSYSEPYRNEVCAFTRKFVERIVRANLKLTDMK